MWQGSLNGGVVKFQIASSDSDAGPWNFLGPGASSSTYYQPSGPDIPITIELASHNNKRYVRYKIVLETNLEHGSSPIINDIIINYSP
jgi:hypothetical protein